MTYSDLSSAQVKLVNLTVATQRSDSCPCGLIKTAAVVIIDGLSSWFGSEPELPQAYTNDELRDLSYKAVVIEVKSGYGLDRETELIMRADLACWNVTHPAELSYRIGMNPLHTRYFAGTNARLIRPQAI